MPSTFTPGSTTFAKSIVLPSDGDDQSAASICVPLEAALTNTAWLKNWTQVGQNWGPLTALTTIGAAIKTGVRWTSAFGHWLAGTTGSGSTQIYQSFDGINWSNFGTAASGGNRPYTIVTTAAGQLVLLIGTGSTPAHITTIYDPTTATWGAGSNGPTGSTDEQGTDIFAFQAGIVFVQTLSAGAALISWSSNAGTTWTNTSSTLPTNFGQNGSGFTTSPLLEAVGSSLCLLFSPVANETHYISSTDGQAWTTQTMPTLLTGEAVVGAGTDTNGVFYCVVSTSTASRVLTSASGTTGWTVAATFAHAAQGFAANTDELAMMLKINGSWRMVLSIDVGVTWAYAKMNAQAAGGVVLASSNGFIYFDTTNYALTHQAAAAAKVT